MKLSIVIPAYNEDGSLTETISVLYATLQTHRIDHEIFVVNDHSTDRTQTVLETLSTKIPTLRHEINSGPLGFGYAVRYGLDNCTGECVAVMMADLSDDPEDLVKFYRKMTEGDYDCVFGTRFSRGGKVYDYPFVKLVLNRVANYVIKIAFRIKLDDCTNAFKLYKKTTLEGLKPLLSPHFNLTIELPLKAIVRGYSYTIVPNSWRNRKHGESKLKIREMGSRYLFIMMYCLIEKYFSRNDFKKKWNS